ncbi:rifampicin phosphotransferase-like isoform X2 [Ornithodoros turicata]
MFFCGTRTTGECFVMRVSRRRGRCLDLWIYLRMKNGDHYELVEHSLLDLSGKEGFAAKGLRIECLAPMRQWRIAFNGLVRSPSSDDSSTSSLHVRLNFLWKASSHVVDIQTNASHDSILDGCLVESLRQTISNCERAYQLVDGYEQRGHLMGTVALGDEKESEMYLWGTRQRLKGCVSTESVTKASHVFGHTKGSQSFHLACYHPNTGYGNSEDAPDMSRFIYGNLQTADGLVDPVTETSPSDLHVSALLGKPSFRIRAGEEHGIQIKDAVTLKRHVAELDGTQLLYIEFTYDGVPGSGLGILDISSPRLFDAFKLNAGLLTQDEGCPSTVPFVANISDVVCRHTSVAGGKGSSLCLLNAISKENKEVFKVPGGVIVTTAAYDLFLRNGPANLLQSILQEAQGEKTIEEVTRVSERAVKNIRNMALPNELKKQIRNALFLALDGDIETKRFAVRSSCTGEDTSEMSGAGQLETFLGIRGIEAVYEAVVKCWASQFSPVAIQYKRRYGQLLNSPMAVVIMEMVASDVAGVMFTCDPRSGNPAVTYITANYGLGESVVSGLVESDIISVNKGSDGKMTLGEVTPGAKGSKIVIDDSGGTRTESYVDEENKCSISEGQALQLARIGSIVDRYFGDSRDMEWAIRGENIFLLQARPITSLYEDTEFESMRTLDTAHQAEREFYTKANVGEVMHRGMSPLGSTVFVTLFVPEWMRFMKRTRKGRLLMSPYFNKTFPVSHYHHLLDLCEFFHYFAPGGGAAVEHMLLSLFGRRLEDKDLEEAVVSRKYSFLTEARFVDFKTRYASGLSLKLAWKKYGNFKIPINSNMSARQLYDCITSNCCNVRAVVSCHMNSSIASSLFNHDVISALCEFMDKSGSVDDDIYTALGSLISSCYNPVSVDVPLALERLAESVAKDMDRKEFAAMTTEQAEKWLRHSGTAASTAFEAFLKTHGHRGYNEFDIHQPTWRMKPTILIKNLQLLVVNVGHKNPVKSHVPLFEAIGSLNLPLSLLQRLRLAYLVEMSRRSVAQRESSKSLLVKAIDTFRVAYNELADKMLQEGFIPERDLLFFMTHHEVGRLLNTRSATILSRAYKRRSLFPKVLELEFPEITRGPIHPEVQEEPQLTDNTTFLKGIPISKGSVEGTARVVTSIDEASAIQRGDILITYATDIGWTPYFTLISGIVTELGGLLSHGAVVAREYGLPCIVGLHGATKFFKTGDRVYLNASQGVLQKVESTTKNMEEMILPIINN